MAAGTLPIYPKAIPGALPTPFTTANALLTGGGTITTVATAGADGARLEGIFLKASAAVTLGMIRIFVKTGGGTYRLIDEVLVTPATTPSATAVSWQYFWTPSGGKGMLLAAGAVVGVSTENNETFNALPYIGDY